MEPPWAWSKNTQGTLNDLSVPELTIWFGGSFDDDYWGSDGDDYMFEGNTVIQGREEPEPGTLALLGLGLEWGRFPPADATATDGVDYHLDGYSTAEDFWAHGIVLDGPYAMIPARVLKSCCSRD